MNHCSNHNSKKCSLFRDKLSLEHHLGIPPIQLKNSSFPPSSIRGNWPFYLRNFIIITMLLLRLVFPLDRQLSSGENVHAEVDFSPAPRSPLSLPKKLLREKNPISSSPPLLFLVPSRPDANEQRGGERCSSIAKHPIDGRWTEQFLENHVERNVPIYKVRKYRIPEACLAAFFHL